MKEQILKKVLLLVASVTEADTDGITADSNLITDIGLSSYEIIQLMWSIEQEFDITIPTRQLSSFTTPEKIAQYILRETEQ